MVHSEHVIMVQEITYTMYVYFILHFPTVIYFEPRVPEEGEKVTSEAERVIGVHCTCGSDRY